ncbi:MAG: site-specific integrase [Pseudomonadota bacterium]
MPLPRVSGTRIRGKRYSLNLAVPVELQPRYGRDRLTDAIGTADPNAAEDAVTLAKAKFIQEISELRNEAGLQELVDQLDDEQRAIYDKAGGLEGLVNAYKTSTVSLAFMAGDIPPHEGEITDFEEEMRNAEFDAAEKALTRHARREAKTLNALGQDVPVPGGNFETLEDIARAFVVDKGWTEQNRQSMSYTMRRWREYHGDLQLQALERSHLADFASAISQLPTSTSKDIRALPMRKAMAVAKSSGLATARFKVRQRMVNHLKSIMSWGINEGKIKLRNDPWAGFKLTKPKEAHSARRKRKVPSFTPSEVRSILDHSGKTFDKKLVDYWLPPIAAYTGARCEELGQLLVGDVSSSDGIWTLSITDEDEEQTVKNAHSVRMVPVPQKIIGMGFVDFVKRRRREGGRYLFLEEFHDMQRNVRIVEMSPDARGRVTSNYGHRFSRKVLQPLGIKKPRQNFHALRHSWTDAARRARIDKEIRRLIAGRLDGADPVEDGYGDEELLRAKLEALNKMEPFVTGEEIVGPKA